MPTEDDIRALCMRVFVAENPDEFNSALADLKIVLRESIAGAYNLAIKMILDQRSGPSLRPITQEQLETAAKEIREQAAAKAAS